MSQDGSGEFRTSASARTAALAVALLIASAGGGFLAYHVFAPARPVIHPAGSVGAGHAELPDAPPAPPRRTVPVDLPAITLPDLDGKPTPLATWAGRPLVINFWAPWCAPCRREIPLLQQLSREWSSSGMQLIGIALDLPEPVRQYVKQHSIRYPVLLGNEGGLQAAAAFGMDTVLPFTVFSDRRGRIVMLKVGELTRTEADVILDRVRDVDQGRMDLATAQAQIASLRKPAQSQQ